MRMNPAEICQIPATMQTGETVRQAETPKAIATEEKSKSEILSLESETEKVKLKTMQTGETVRQADTPNAIATVKVKEKFKYGK